MDYTKYRRDIIMLETGRRETQSGQEAERGYLKLETGNNKGALRCVVQKLRYGKPGDYLFKLLLFGKRGEKVLHAVVGDLVINRQGYGESYFRFDPRDVDGRGNSLDDYSVAIVAAASTTDIKEPLHPLLRGVLREDAVPASSDAVPQEEKEAEETTEGSAEAPPVEAGLSEEEAISEEAPSPEKRTYNDFYNKHLLHFCRYTGQVSGFYEKVNPFEEDPTGAQWLKLLNVEEIPLVSPGARHFAKMHRHYLFGAKPDSEGMAEKYYFAVPGRPVNEDQPDGGLSGFTHWQPFSGSEDPMVGYWIACVDAKSGDIEEY